MDFQAKLKAVYWRQSKIAPLIEGLEEEIPQQTLDDYYVKLNIIIKQDDDKKQGNYEKISGKKQEVEIANIFDQITNKTEPHRLLILGGAGVGKSILMQYIAYKWSRGDLWAGKFDYVYRISLKTLLNDEWKENYEVKDLKADTLKCLAHYHLIADSEGTRNFKLEEMVWLEKKEKVLLLLDGYDEVAREKDGIYKDVFIKIFQHENLILTSRPNAIHKEMAEKFGRVIENTGLDHDGINQYSTQYFKNDKEKGAKLQEFLRKNNSIKDICRIPVNIAVMCFIWSEGEDDETTKKISNVSDLYSHMVNQLGFRHDTKQNNDQNRDELLSKWRIGDIYLDELQVLQHVAYKGMTGGGFEVPEDKRTETLIIKGMTKKDDKDGISIQSSILYLQEKLQRDMPVINKIYKYGLLKPDGGSVTGASTKKDPSDTDLFAQNFNFIHLSFQEFLTASYFVKKLLKEDSKEQEKVGNFIAYHRNEPRYLMTLKFMAGILSSCEDEEANDNINIFWDAVLCNPDGVLELGVEAKVTLLMHLIGQTRDEKRVPNMSIAVDLIDSVVLEDISGWSTQIKESDYLSENMKEGLIEYFLKDNLKWLGKKCQEMKRKFDSKSKSNLKEDSLNVEEIIDIIVSMLHKFSKEQRIQIFQKLFKILQAENNQNNWQLLKKAIEGVITIQEKVEINLNNIEKRMVLDVLKKTVHDSNLTKVSLIAIQQVFNEIDDALFLEVIKGMIEETPKDVSHVEVYQTILGGVVQIAQKHHENQMLKHIVDVLIPLLGDSKLFVRENIAATIAELIGSIGIKEKDLVKEIVGAYISLWQSLPKEKGFVQTNIVKLAKINNEFVHDTIKDLDSALRNCSETKIKKRAVDTMIEVIKLGKASDSQFFRDIITSFLIPLLDEGDDAVRNVISSEIPLIVRIADGNDPQLARDIIKTLLSFMQEDGSKDAVARIIPNLVIIRDIKDEQFIRDIIKAFLKEEHKSSISDVTVELIKVSNIKDSKFIKEVIANFAPSLKSSSDTTRLFEAEKIVWLMERGGITDIQLVIDITNLAALVSSDIHVEYLIRTAKVVAEVIRVAKITNEQLAKDIFRSVTGCFKNWISDAKTVLISPLFGLMKMKTIISDTQYVKDSILLASYFESFNETAYKDLGEILVVSGAIKDTQFVGGLLNSLISLMERNQLTSEMIPAFEAFMKKLNEESEIELARVILIALARVFTFSTITFHSSVERLMIEITKKRAGSNLNFLQDVMTALVPVFENNPSESILRFGLNIIQEILKINGATTDNKFAQDCIGTLTLTFKTPATEAKLSGLQIIEKLLSKGGTSLDDQILKNLVEALIGNLGDKNEGLKISVSKTIMNLVKTPQLAVHAINSLIIFRDTSQIVSFLTGLVQVKGVINLELIQESIGELTSLIQSPRFDVKFPASKIILELVKISQKEKDEQFCKVIIQKIIPFLQDPDENTQLLSLDLISKIIEGNDSEGLAKYVVPEFASLLSGDADQMIQTSALEKIVIFSKKGGQDVLKNTLIPLLQISEEENWRSIVLKNIGDLAKAIEKIEIEIAKSAIPILFSLFKSPNYSIQSSAAATLIDLIKACHPIEIQYIRSLVNNLVSLIKETSGDDAKCCLLDTLATLVKTIETTPDLNFIREVFVDILIPNLHDDDLRSSAASWIPEMIGIAVKTDKQITREIIKILLPLLPDAKVKQNVSGAISQILIKYDTKDEQWTKEVLDSLFVYLKDEKHMLDIRTSSSIIEVIKAGDIKDPQFLHDVINNFAPSLKSPDDTTRFIEAEKIVWLMERGGIKRAQLVRDIVNIAVLVPPTIHAEYLIRTATVVAEAIKVAKIADAELAKDVIKNVTGCLKNWFDDARLILLDPIIELVKIKSVIVDIHFVQEFIETLATLSGNFNEKKLMSMTIKNIVDLLKITDLISETEFVIQILDILFTFLQGRQEAVQEVMELFINENSIELIQSIFSNMIKLLSDCKQEEMGSVLSNCIILIAQKYGSQDSQFMKGILEGLISVLKDSQAIPKPFVFSVIEELINSKILTEKNLVPDLLSVISSNTKKAEEILEKLLKIIDSIDDELFKTLTDDIMTALDKGESENKSLVFTLITIHAQNDVERIRHFVNATALLFQIPHFSITKLFILPALKAHVLSFLEYPNVMTEYLNHSFKGLRDEVNSTLFECFEDYIARFGVLDELFKDSNNLTLDTIKTKLFEGLSGELEGEIEQELKENNDGKLKSLLARELNHIQNLDGPQITSLALVITGHASLSEEGSDSRKLVELAREALMIQLRCLTEKELTWINENYDWLISLSPETKLFYKKIYHKLLEDGHANPLEEELIIKFINQGLTTSLTREGGIIFEGKMYKLQGENIEFAVEKIAKIIISQQQEILALQYKVHEPIFKKKFAGGMKEAAADIKEVRSLVDSRHVLQTDCWLMTRLKSLKFRSEMMILEQRSAFGDHVVYHVNQKQLFRIYPEETLGLEEIFGSYIYGEAYQGEIKEIDDKVGLELLKGKEEAKGGGKVKSKQIYFQQELLKRGNEDRNSAVEEELAKKLDNNRVVLQAKLKDLNLKQSEKVCIEDYYEGFVSAFSSTFTSSQAILSGKLSIDDGEDFFSPVSLFIKLVSLAPFGIGDVVSGGLEAAKSHIKGTRISNEAKFIKEIAIDAVELSELVSKVVLEIVSKKEQREKILKERDVEEPKSLVNKVKNLVFEKLEKFKNLAEKYTKMKNFFEKEIQASPAFRLGENDANEIMKRWINLKVLQLDLKLTLEEKQNKFVKMILGGEETKIEYNGKRPSTETPLSSVVVVVNSPESRNSNSPNKKHLIPVKEAKGSCHCQIF